MSTQSFRLKNSFPQKLYILPLCIATLSLDNLLYFYFGYDRFYHIDKIEKIDEEFWNEEIKINENARFMEKKIWDSLKTGYSWRVKRTMGQPAVVNLYYGYLAIAIAVLTEGILYSDDGAWDYECFPIEGKSFEKEYLNLDKLNNITLKHSIESCLFSLKN